jgi:type IV secretory pathway TraG/TraD family ATPase VirD4
MTGGSAGNDDVIRYVVAFGALSAGVVYVFGVLFWFAGQLSAVLAGNGWPDSSPMDVFGILKNMVQHPSQPALGWPAQAAGALGPTWLLLTILLVLLVPAGYLLYRLVRFGLNWRRRREFRVFRLGFASGNEVERLLSAKAVTGKAKSVKPSSAGRKQIDPLEVGYFLGRDLRSRRELYASVEDVFIVLAPPRQGKDVHFCAPFTIDAPGPCIVTSTRADAFTNTYAMRAKVGKVYVFDPNNLTYWPERLRWSPVRGCEDPLIAQARASALIAGAGLNQEGEFAIYIAGGTTILRCFLHAAALTGRTMRDVQRWVSQQVNPEPIAILRQMEALGQSAEGWASALESLSISLEPRVRGSMFSNANIALNCFADPGVMDACSPATDEVFDLAEFMSGRNTLYVLGKERKNGSIAPVVTAMMEDLFDGARKIASRMPSSRLDPPLTVELNEAAHIAPLPNLPGYMGDSGGFSIALHVYLQSLSQARAKWGEHEAMIMWDNAAVRIIMGGAGNVDDLDDISRLMGEFEEKKWTRTSGTSQTDSVTKQRRRVLSAEEIRTLPFGRAVVVARAARPVEAVLTPWWKRTDGDEIAKGKARTEKAILEYAEAADQAAAQAKAQAAGAQGAYVPGAQVMHPQSAYPQSYPAAQGWPPAPHQPGGVQQPIFPPATAPPAVTAGPPPSLGQPIVGEPPGMPPRGGHGTYPPAEALLTGVSPTMLPPPGGPPALTAGPPQTFDLFGDPEEMPPRGGNAAYPPAQRQPVWEEIGDLSDDADPDWPPGRGRRPS